MTDRKVTVNEAAEAAYTLGDHPHPWEDASPNLQAAYLRAVSGLDDTACGDYPAPCNCDDPATHGGHP